MTGDRFEEIWLSFRSDPPGGEDPPPYLHFEHITGISASRDGDAVPKSLAEPVFGQRPGAGEQHTYALIDAAKVPGLPETLETSRLEHACLYLGERDVTGQAAPWLVQLQPEGKFTRNLFRQSASSWHLWGRDCLILLRSNASLDELVAHFRRFTRVRDRTGRIVFFRFWDPLVISMYFSARRDDPARVAQVFHLANGQTLRVIAPVGEDQATIMSTAPEPSTSSPRRAMIFDDQDEAIMHEVAFAGFARQLVPWLASEYSDQLVGRSVEETRAIAHHVIAAGRRAGLMMKEDFSFLAQMMMTSGGWFLDDGYPVELCRLIAETPAPKAQALAAAYADIQQETPQAQLVSQWPEVREWLAALPPDEAVTPAVFRQFTSRFLTMIAARIPDAIASTRARLRQIGLSDQLTEGRAVILTLIFGPRFFEDPFRSWVHLSPEDAINAAWREITK